MLLRWYSRTMGNGLIDNKNYPVNPYEEKGQHHLLREITLTTLGWLHSAFIQCVFMWLWASGRLSYYNDFWSRPFFSIFILLSITFWREFHFYWVKLDNFVLILNE